MLYYRNLTHEQYMCLKEGGDLKAANPEASYPINMHIGNGRLKTQYISVSKNFFTMFTNRRFKFGDNSAIIRIDFPDEGIDGVEVIDVSTDEYLDKYGVEKRQPRNYAKAAREVLLVGTIPAKYCTIIAEENVFPCLPDNAESLVSKYTSLGLTRKSVITMRRRLDDFGSYIDKINSEQARQVIDLIAVLRFVNNFVKPDNTAWWSINR